jgi:hypothetical protein
MLYILIFYVLGQKLNYCSNSVKNVTIVCIERVPLLQFMVFFIGFSNFKNTQNDKL